MNTFQVARTPRYETTSVVFLRRRTRYDTLKEGGFDPFEGPSRMWSWVRDVEREKEYVASLRNNDSSVGVTVRHDL